MIYVCSDWHLTEETIESVLDQVSKLQKEDILLNLGDLCNDWKLENGRPWFLKELETLACQIVFLDGNHDDMGYLDDLPTSLYFGAKGHRIGKNIFHVCRGELLTIEGMRFLTLGGGYSGEGYISRHPDIWQPRETPSPKEMDHILNMCEHCEYQVDYILSHAAPMSIIRKEVLGREFNHYLSFLDGIRANMQFKRWYFGHFHGQKQLEQNFELVYQTPQKLLK